MRHVSTLLTVMLLACSQSPKGGHEPQAVLTAPGCVLVGERVMLDGSQSSDPDGDINRYIFTVGHRAPSQVLTVPRMNYYFDKVAKKGDAFVGYPVLLRVVDDEGNESSDEALIYVVNSPEECAPFGGYTPPGMPDPVDLDVQPEADLLDVIEELPPEILIPDDVPEVKPDIKPDVPPDIAPGLCPYIAGTYRLQVFCVGQLYLELDAVLNQEGCNLEEENGILEGTIDAEGNISITSPYPELQIGTCSGKYTTGENSFQLECDSGCTAVYLP